jgi:quercetin dioxygenase-like cupin family protein
VRLAVELRFEFVPYNPEVPKVASKFQLRTRRIEMRFLSLPVMVLSFLCAAAAQAPNSNPLAAARVFNSDEATPRTAPNGAVGRSIFSGTLATGETVAAHETMQPAGTAPNPAHRIQHSELIIVQEGTVEFEHDGKSERAGAGSVIYVAMGTMHTLKNIGDSPAKYIVIQIGGDTKK